MWQVLPTPVRETAHEQNIVEKQTVEQNINQARTPLVHQIEDARKFSERFGTTGCRSEKFFMEPLQSCRFKRLFLDLFHQILVTLKLLIQLLGLDSGMDGFFALQKN